MAALESCLVLIPAVPAAEKIRIYDKALNIIKNITDITGGQGPSGPSGSSEPSWRSPLGDVITDVYFSPTASEDAVCDPDALDATIVFHRPVVAKYFVEIAKTEFPGMKLIETQVFNAVVAHVHPEVVATLQSRGILQATSQRMKHIGGIVIHNEPRFAIKGLMPQVFACGNVLQAALKHSATMKTETRVPSTPEEGDNRGPINGPNASFTEQSQREHVETSVSGSLYPEADIRSIPSKSQATGDPDMKTPAVDRAGTKLSARTKPVVQDAQESVPARLETSGKPPEDDATDEGGAFTTVYSSTKLHHDDGTNDDRKLSRPKDMEPVDTDMGPAEVRGQAAQPLEGEGRNSVEEVHLLSGYTEEEERYTGVSNSVAIATRDEEHTCNTHEIERLSATDDERKNGAKTVHFDDAKTALHGLSKDKDHKGFLVDKYASNSSISSEQMGEGTGPVQSNDEEIDALCTRTDSPSLPRHSPFFEVDRYYWQYLTNRQQKKLEQIENKYSVKLTTHNDGLRDVIHVTGQNDVMMGKAKSELKRTYTSVAYSLTTKKTKVNSNNTISIAQLKQDKDKLLINEEADGIIAITGLSNAVVECCNEINGEGRSRSEQATGRQDTAERGIDTGGHSASSGQVPLGVPSAATSGQVPLGVPSAATSYHAPLGVPSAATSGQVPQDVPLAATSGQVPPEVPLAATSGQVPLGVSSAATSGQISPEVPLAATSGQVPLGVPPGATSDHVPRGVPSAATSGQVPLGIPPAATSDQVPRGVPSAATSDHVSRDVPSAVNTPETDSARFQSGRNGISLDARNNASSIDIRHSWSDGKPETYNTNRLGDNNGSSESEAAGRRHDNAPETRKENLILRRSDHKDAFPNPEGGIIERQHGAQQPTPANVGAAAGGNPRDRDIVVPPAESGVTIWSTDWACGSQGSEFSIGEEPRDSRAACSSPGDATLPVDAALWRFISVHNPHLKAKVEQIPAKCNVKVAEEICASACNLHITGEKPEDVATIRRKLRNIARECKKIQLDVPMSREEDLSEIQSKYPSVMLFRESSERVGVVGKVDLIDSQIHNISSDLSQGAANAAHSQTGAITDADVNGFSPSTGEKRVAIGQEDSDRSPSAAMAQSVALEEQSDKRKVNKTYSHTGSLSCDPALWNYMTIFTRSLTKLVKKVAEKHRIEISDGCDNGSPSISGTTQEDVYSGRCALELLYEGMSSIVQVKELEVEWPAHEDLSQVQAEFPKILLWRRASGKVCIVGNSDAVDSECERIIEQLKDDKRRHRKPEMDHTGDVLRDSAARKDGIHGVSQRKGHNGCPPYEYAISSHQIGESTGPVQSNDEEMDTRCTKTGALSLSEIASSFEVDRYYWHYLTNRQQKKLVQIENKYSVTLTAHKDGLMDVIHVTGQDDVMMGKARSELERTYTSVAYSLTTKKTKLNKTSTVSIAQLKQDKDQLLINEEDNGIIAITGRSDAVAECCKQINADGRSEQATGRQDLTERSIVTDDGHGATSGHDPWGVPSAVTSGHVPRGVSPAVTSGHVPRGVPSDSTRGQVHQDVPSAATSGHVPRGVSSAATSGQVPQDVPSAVNTPALDSASGRPGMSLDARNNASSIDGHSWSDGKPETYDTNRLGNKNGSTYESEAAGRIHDNSGTWEENLPSQRSDNKDAFLNPEDGISDRQHGGQQPMPANVGAAGGRNRRNRKLKVSPAESDVNSYRSTDARDGSRGRGFDGGRDFAWSGGAVGGSHGRGFDRGKDSAWSGGAVGGSHGRGFDRGKDSAWSGVAVGGSHGRGFDRGKDSAWSGGAVGDSHGRGFDRGRDSAWSGGAADGGVQRCEPRGYGASLPPPRKQPVRRGDPTADNKQEAECSICCSEISNRKVLEKCQHAFCAPCIDTWFAQKPTCPVCGQSYGAVTGNQPDGTMTWHYSPMNLPGHLGCGTIVIDYWFPSGIQTAAHPFPGKPYTGTSRTAYLPGKTQGRNVLRLLKMAFDAKLTFTIGTSVTTGVDNTVTWNDIHHKTNNRRYGVRTEYGYPDPGYLNRVTEELAAKGIK